jgi:hypothetical protein
MHKKLILSFLSISLSFQLFSQNQLIHDLNYSMYEEYYSENSKMHLNSKPFSYDQIIEVDSAMKISFKNKNAHPFFNNELYKKNTDIISLKINPILSSSAVFSADDGTFFYNRSIGAGFEFSHKRNIFLSFNYFVSQKNKLYKSDLQERYQIVPHYETANRISGYLHNFQSFTAEAAVKAGNHIYFHIGKGKHFWGHGYRSLFLSDNSNAYPYFKVAADIWKIKYIWLIMQTNDIQSAYGSLDYNLYQKAIFLHYFSLNLTERINVNFFESVITNPYDINGNYAGYEMSYFNPVIFYRPVEFYNGTSDNALMGIGLNIRLFKSLYLYSQFVLDDLIISRVNDGTGWWGNKYGLQTGIKSYNFMNIKGLFIRAELNFVRPYTYSHGQIGDYEDITNISYGSYVQALAHPLGANFIEAVAQLKYRSGRFLGYAQLNFAEKGIDDTNFTSYGGDIYMSYNLRPDDTGIRFLQGNQVNFTYARAGISYIINPAFDLILDSYVQYRDLEGMNEQYKFLFGIGLSTLIFNENNDFF